MAGSFVVTTDYHVSEAMTSYAVAWTADGSGAVNTTTLTLRRGFIRQVEFVPGTVAPTGGYKARLLNANSTDMLVNLGNGASGLSASVGQAGCPLLPQTFEATGAQPHPQVFVADGDYVPTISGAGNGGQGTIILLIATSSTN